MLIDATSIVAPASSDRDVVGFAGESDASAIELTGQSPITPMVPRSVHRMMVDY